MAKALYPFWDSVSLDIRHTIVSLFEPGKDKEGKKREWQERKPFKHSGGIAPEACPIGVALVMMTGDITKGQPQPGQAVQWLKEARVKGVVSNDVCQFINTFDRRDICSSEALARVLGI